LFRNGQDPLRYAAARLLAPFPSEPLDLETRDFRRRPDGELLSEVLLFAAPHAIAPAFIRILARQEQGFDLERIEYPAVRIPEDENAGDRDPADSNSVTRRVDDREPRTDVSLLAMLGRLNVTDEELHRRIQRLFPELGYFLRDDTFDLLAARQGINPDNCWEWFRLHNEYGDTSATALRRLVMGLEPAILTSSYEEWREVVWNQLQLLDCSQEVEPLIASKRGSLELHDALFSRDITTPIGRVHGRLSYSEARSRPSQFLMDDAVKAVSFAVASAGFRLVGVAASEIVVEIPGHEDVPAKAAEIHKLVQRVLGQVLDPIPVVCECECRDSW
jgi:hypothetical protein